MDEFSNGYDIHHKDIQLPVATGVTDGTVNPWNIIADLTEALRANRGRNDVLEEVALEFEKMCVFGDTASSFATFVRGMKR